MAASLGRCLELKMSVLYRYSRKRIKDIGHIEVSRWLYTCFASLFYLTFTSTLRWQITMALLFLEMKQYICCFCTKQDMYMDIRGHRCIRSFSYFYRGQTKRRLSF